MIVYRRSKRQGGMGMSSRVVKAACAVWGVKRSQVLSNKRAVAGAVLARQASMYALVKLLKAGHREVAELFGRDRTTVYNSMSKVEGLASVDKVFAREFDAFLADVRKMRRMDGKA